MLKKAIMITLYLVVGFQAKAATPSTEAKPSKVTKNICMMHSGDVGKLKFKGSTYEEAFSRVTDECFKRRNDLFVKRNAQQPDQERQIQFAEACVNNIQCI